jgi:hypothetical protein
VEAISATRRNNTGIAPSFIVMKAEASDNAEKRRRNHWDVFIITCISSGFEARRLDSSSASPKFAIVNH